MTRIQKFKPAEREKIALWKFGTLSPIWTENVQYALNVFALMANSAEMIARMSRSIKRSLQRPYQVQTDFVKLKKVLCSFKMYLFKLYAVTIVQGHLQ